VLGFLGPRFRGDERGESSPDYQPFVPAKAGTQRCTNGRLSGRRTVRLQRRRWKIGRRLAGRHEFDRCRGLQPPEIAFAFRGELEDARGECHTAGPLPAFRGKRVPGEIEGELERLDRLRIVGSGFHRERPTLTPDK
jgi:hypothetical protein